MFTVVHHCSFNLTVVQELYGVELIRMYEYWLNHRVSLFMLELHARLHLHSKRWYTYYL